MPVAHERHVTEWRATTRQPISRHAHAMPTRSETAEHTQSAAAASTCWYASSSAAAAIPALRSTSSAA